mgnify:CR=1 FL=1
MLTLDNLEWRHPPYQMHYTLHAAAGERLAILGTSGAGKSTLLNLIAGFLPAHSGRLLINGADTTAAPPAARPISMLYQEHNLFSHLNVRDNIAIGLSPNLKLTPDQRAQLQATAEKTGLAGLLDRLPEQLSGGQKQRVALARCLLRDRPLLLLDEPSLGLAPIIIAQIFDIIRDIRDQGITIFLVEQNAHKALQIADRGYILELGQITHSDTGENLLSSDVVRKAYLGG